VKRAIETKEEMGDYIRSYSISQFQKTYSLPEVSMVLFFSYSLRARMHTQRLPGRSSISSGFPVPHSYLGISAHLGLTSALKSDLVVH
jgi:hypothetical protein